MASAHKILDTDESATAGTPSEDLTLAEIASRLWAGKLWLVAGIVLGLIAAVFYLNRATFFYTASMKVTAAPSSQGASPGRGSLGGLASLAGVSLGSSAGASPFDMYLETLTSEDVARRLAADQKIMRTIFASDWDAEGNRWREPPAGLRARLSRGVKETLGIPVKEWRRPDERELAGFLGGHLAIQRDTRSSVVGVSLDYPDPRFAKELLSAVSREADRRIRESVLSRSRSYGDYLERKLPTVTIAEQRVALVDTLSEQEKAIMMASSSAPFAATVISGPVVSSMPTRPSGSMVVLAFLVVGLVAGAIVATINWGGVRRSLARDTAGD